MNSGYSDGHCSAIFDPNYKYFGIGYWPSMSTATIVYIKNGPPRDYPIYMASHFDEKNKIHSNYYNINNKHLTFLLGWYGLADTINKIAQNVYILYKNKITEMNLIFGNESNGIYEINFEYPTQCEPYSFYVKTIDNILYRLPEQNEYFYGTSWIQLESGTPSKPGIDYPDCNENHYFKDDKENNQWIANGANNITKSQITFIDHNNCQGCNKINALLNILQEFIDNGYQIPNNNNPSTTGSFSHIYFLLLPQLLIVCFFCI